ncbi:hypothetical protein NQZ68_013756, partial [Dissostichus eleginoides]
AMPVPPTGDEEITGPSPQHLPTTSGNTAQPNHTLYPVLQQHIQETGRLSSQLLLTELK